jgi:hypothetical protein
LDEIRATGADVHVDSGTLNCRLMPNATRSAAVQYWEWSAWPTAVLN